MALIDARALSKTYGTGGAKVRALDEVTFSVRAGESVAIMGSSGSGKSTLMHILGCLDRPSEGDYLLDGVAVDALSRDARAALRNKTIGFVFQSFNLLPRTSALENVELPLFYAGVSRTERRRRAREALVRVGLGDRLEAMPNELSGGEQQRVAIARAIVTGPRLILADEPTGNLDTGTSRGIMALFMSLVANSGITLVVVTHEADIAAWLDRIVTMKDGRIASDRRAALPDRAALEGLRVLPGGREVGP